MFCGNQRGRRASIGVGLLTIFATTALLAQANMRRDAALSLYLGTNGTNDNKGFYAGCMDSSNGFAYFGAYYVYKVDVRGAVPVQVGDGVSLGGHSLCGAMDPTAGCAYFAYANNIVQILANGTNTPSAGNTMNGQFGGALILSMMLDDSDPANHYLYVMTETGLSTSTLYKVALNQFPGASAIVGSASVNSNEPAMNYGAIDLTNRFAYFGTFAVISNQVPYITKFALGSGANPPARVGGVALDSTFRAVGGVALDIANGYGYCSSDDTDSNFGSGRVYKWALNGANAPRAVSYVDMQPNQGFTHVALIRPDRGLLYFASDLSYPAQVNRFRLPPGTNAPVETGTLYLQSITNTAALPAWGTNPTNTGYWGEVFIRSIAYDSVRDFVYFGRDHADEQGGFYTNEIIKAALDRDEMLVALATDAANTNNTIPYRESFESYANGFSLVGTNGWFGQDTMMGVVVTNDYAFGGDFPIPGPHQLVLQVDGAVTNRFRPSADSNVWVDLMVQGKYWTDPLMLTLSNTPFALCVTTNGHLAVWNCTNPPATGNGWTELLDTSIGSNQFVRVTLEAAYTRDANGEFYYRVWVNGAASTNPRTWYAAAYTNQNYFGDVVAQGRFALDDLVVTVPVITLTNENRNANGSVSLAGQGMPGLAHRTWATTNLSAPASWQILSTNVAGADGSWQFTDTNAANYRVRFYRASLP